MTRYEPGKKGPLVGPGLYRGMKYDPCFIGIIIYHYKDPY